MPTIPNMVVMLKLIFYFVKSTIFAVVVLVLANIVHFNGRSVSQYVGLAVNWVSDSESSREAKRWAKKTVTRAKEGLSVKKPKQRDLDQITDDEQAELRRLLSKK